MTNTFAQTLDARLNLTGVRPDLFITPKTLVHTVAAMGEDRFEQGGQVFECEASGQLICVGATPWMFFHNN